MSDLARHITEMVPLFWALLAATAVLAAVESGLIVIALEAAAGSVILIREGCRRSR
jgi:hypothetical protein